MTKSRRKNDLETGGNVDSSHSVIKGGRDVCAQVDGDPVQEVLSQSALLWVVGGDQERFAPVHHAIWRYCQSTTRVDAQVLQSLNVVRMAEALETTLSEIASPDSR